MAEPSKFGATLTVDSHPQLMFQSTCVVDIPGNLPLTCQLVVFLLRFFFVPIFPLLCHVVIDQCHIDA